MKCAFISFAAARSTVRLSPTTHPYALIGSASNARRKAVPPVSAIATPEGFACLITAAHGSGNSVAMRRARSRSRRLL